VTADGIAKVRIANQAVSAWLSRSANYASRIPAEYATWLAPPGPPRILNPSAKSRLTVPCVLHRAAIARALHLKEPSRRNRAGRLAFGFGATHMRITEASGGWPWGLLYWLCHLGVGLLWRTYPLSVRWRRNRLTVGERNVGTGFGHCQALPAWRLDLRLVAAESWDGFDFCDFEFRRCGGHHLTFGT